MKAIFFGQLYYIKYYNNIISDMAFLVYNFFLFIDFLKTNNG